ncbi:hypothetical protein FRC07_009005 [Ceratobasidium sp. 392]|nr:hypothetical protein FRC07_009005 [Ceratobasidium sp. 392]
MSTSTPSNTSEPPKETKKFQSTGEEEPAQQKKNSSPSAGNKSEGEPKTERFRLKVFKLESTDAAETAEEEESKSEEKSDEEKADEKKDGEKKDDEKKDDVEGGDGKDGNPPKPTMPPSAKSLTTVEYKGITQAKFEETTLADIRRKIAPVMSEAFRFCDESGAISQDGKTLSSYISELKDTTIKPDIPINIYVTSFKRPKTSAAELLDNPPFVLKFVQKLKEDEVQKESTLHSSSLPNVGGGKIKLKELRKYVKAMSASASRHQFCLEDGHTVDDGISLKEYVASLSKTVEEDETPQATSSIEIYFTKPGAIKKSKSKGASEEIKDHPALKPGDLTLRDVEAFNAKRDKELREVKEELDAANFRLEGGKDDAKVASALTEDEWAVIIRNCNLMFGWVVDSNNNQVVRAPKAAFQLRNGLNMGTALAAIKTDEPDADATPPADDSAESTTPPEITAPTKARGIPHFSINDDSRVEITMTSHEFQESMAKSHFSATSVEAEASGGFGSFSGGVSGGYSQESSSEEKSSSQKNEKTMIGTYRFPRATIHLTPNDLEPTPELEAAIKRIRARKNVMDLRQLHKDFGHLFCRKVVIGGCLQTTKTITMTTETSEKSERSQFKASVGAAVQTPWVSASVKASHGQGDALDAGSTKTDTKEQLVFEATGGNTIFASDPMRWTLSVESPNNWRVIEQDSLSSLADAISEIPGFVDAPMWFMQAVPSLSKYVEIPRSRTLNVRFKAVVNKQVQDKLLGTDGHKYLGHDNAKILDFIHRHLKPVSGARSSSITPRYELGKMVLDMTAFTELNLFIEVEAARTKVAKAEAAKAELAKLEATQAEVTKLDKDKSLTDWAQALMAHLGRLKEAEQEANKLEAAQKELTTAENALKVAKESNETAIKKFSSEFKNTVWKLEVPDGGVLAHEARVSVRSLAVEPNPTLSVYRNAQGVYLPTMSSYDGPCFWRILKRDPASREGDPIQDGDDIRLCWRFSDQADGFRDFEEDTFGRRRFTKPNDAGDVLYLKIPYPPIQSSSADIALVLSSAKTRDPIVERFKTLPKGSESNYNLHDLSFRIDSAGDNGMGESMDYMAPVVDSQKLNKDISWGQDKPQFSAPALFVASILLPGATGPVAGSMLRALML